MILRCISDATSEPVTLEEVKIHLRLSTAATVEDTLLNAYIKTARLIAENKMQRQILPAVWELTLDAFPDGGIELPMPPLSTNTTNLSVGYMDSSGSTQTLSATGYEIDMDSEPGWIFPSYNNDWPDTRDTPNAVKIRYKSGYVDSTSVPEPIKSWLKIRVGAMYENRESVVADRGQSIQQLPRDYIDGLLDPYTVMDV